MENRNAERKKLKAEVPNEDLHRGDADNPESAEEPDKRAKRRKQKAEVDNSEYLQVENDGSECVQDSTPDGKTKKKKRKKTRLENDGASNQSSPKKKTLQAGPSDEGEGKVAKAKKARKKKKNRKAPPEATKNTKDQCLQYLKDWQGPSWKFCKNKQLWLLSHAFEEDMIPEDDFEILLRYIEGLKGAARERLQQSANKFLEKANEDDDEVTEECGEGGEDGERSLRCLGSGVSVGMVLMDYRVQMTATKALVSEVFSTLATANALVELEGAFMLHSELQTQQVLLGRLYNLYVDNITAVLCACLKLCKQHLEFLGVVQQAANFKGGESGAASAPTQCVHLKISLSWKSDYERLFDSVVELVADFEEQVQLQISG
ncbi:hypothetical protein HPB47_021235 [Ixodes persulcatus]|uniref:Uncharacterized protein n=1 Tax=Ixodes persulcatus TaxID=34615 RepID=A0AC60QD58_IXOPE|nr:hypothetical protein HPB47_021235 [Ixodes persulcatus]